MMLNTSGNFSKCVVVVFIIFILCMEKLNIATVHSCLYIFKIRCVV